MIRWSPLLLVLASCGGSAEKPQPEAATSDGPTAEDAKAFVDEVDAKLRVLWTASESAHWTHATDITDAHEAAAAAAEEANMAYMSQIIPKAASFNGVEVDADTARKLHLIKNNAVLPAPSDETKRAELAGIVTKLGSLYGKGKYCPEGGECQTLGDLETTLRTSRDPDALLEAWTGWRTVSPQMRPLYQRFAELGNEGSREIGFADMGAGWRSGYDMSPEDFEVELDRLWGQVAPLYEQLHCHVRAELNETYGDDAVALDKPIPAHLTGNMWAQSWEHIYPLVEPFPGEPSLDVTEQLVAKGYEDQKMVRAAEGFFTSMGLDPLPETFWERSMFTKPDDREVVCHASAWDVGMQDDLRIKMCIKPTMEDYVTIHHELGHNYYQRAYKEQPPFFTNSANDGFHEALGDTIALSCTPSYLKQIGLMKEDPKPSLNPLMRQALAKIAFLPFGVLIDKWRWQVFSGEVTPENYNAAWWKLRKEYQGIAPVNPRTEAGFDPGAKYHIAGNVPYIRYFLAHILQFQFHRALCKIAGQTGPLHTCSIYGNKDAGKRLNDMMAMGLERPWPEALEALTGETQMDATAILDYFKPLHDWLKEQNKGQTCGW